MRRGRRRGREVERSRGRWNGRRGERKGEREGERCVGPVFPPENVQIYLKRRRGICDIEVERARRVSIRAVKEQ